MSTERKPMTALEIAERAYALIEDPKRWTQGELARDADGASVDPQEDEAVCFCSSGAILHFTGVPDKRWERVCAAVTKSVSLTVTYFNGTRSHAEVLAGWRKAIESLRTKESPCT